MAHNEWDADACRPHAKALYNVGRADRLDRDALTRLVASINCGTGIVRPDRAGWLVKRSSLWRRELKPAGRSGRIDMSGSLATSRRSNRRCGRRRWTTRRVRTVHQTPIHVVFDRLTTPSHLARSWGPDGYTSPLDSIVVDLRPGGDFHVDMVFGDGAHGHRCEPATTSSNAPTG